MNARPLIHQAPQTFLDPEGPITGPVLVLAPSRALFVPLKDRPVFCKLGVGYCRVRQGHVTTTFFFDDEAGQSPLGWMHGDHTLDATYRDGRGHVRPLQAVEALS